jgi:hypothetical protein
MRMLRPRTPLFNVATDDASNGGGASTITIGNPPPDNLESITASLIPTPAATKPGVIATAAALLRGAKATAADVAALRADITTRDATIEQLRSEIAACDATITSLNTELATFRTQAADLQAVVTQLESQRTDVQTEVIHQLAVAGIPENQLPRGSASAAPQATAEELWQQAEAASDPKEKGRLANQALKLSEGKVHSLKAAAALN